jgi:hypothetical protein
LPVLTEAMNTYNSCLAVLVEKGFKVSAEFPEDKSADWRADNGQVCLAASSPVALLGLAALWEARGEYWRQKNEDPGLYDRVLEGASI